MRTCLVTLGLLLILGWNLGCGTESGPPDPRDALVPVFPNWEGTGAFPPSAKIPGTSVSYMDFANLGSRITRAYARTDDLSVLSDGAVGAPGDVCGIIVTIAQGGIWSETLQGNPRYPLPADTEICENQPFMHANAAMAIGEIERMIHGLILGVSEFQVEGQKFIEVWYCPGAGCEPFDERVLVWERAS